MPAPGLAWQACLEKTGLELEMLTDIVMLLMVAKGIRGRIGHAIHRYAKANNKYIKKCDKDIISSYLMCLDANNLYGWGISQKLPVNGFKRIKKKCKFDKYFIKNYTENTSKGYILEIDVEYLKKLFNLASDLPFLAERKKMKNCNKLVCNIHDKESNVVHIRASKKALSHGLILKKSTESNQI